MICLFQAVIVLFSCYNYRNFHHTIDDCISDIEKNIHNITNEPKQFLVRQTEHFKHSFSDDLWFVLKSDNVR